MFTADDSFPSGARVDGNDTDCNDGSSPEDDLRRFAVVFK